MFFSVCNANSRSDHFDERFPVYFDSDGLFCQRRLSGTGNIATWRTEKFHNQFVIDDAEPPRVVQRFNHSLSRHLDLCRRWFLFDVSRRLSWLYSACDGVPGAVILHAKRRKEREASSRRSPAAQIDSFLFRVDNFSFRIHHFTQEYALFVVNCRGSRAIRDCRNRLFVAFLEILSAC